MEGTQSSGVAGDLKRWMQVTNYETEQHAYQTTIPSNALAHLRDVILDVDAFGFERARVEQG
jgi:aspartate aminotransferase-like enzyme